MAASPANDEEIFHAARGISDPNRRREYLQHACGEDETRLSHIEALLAIDKAPDSLLDNPVVGNGAETIALRTVTGSGAIIAGRYKLLEAIGEGGMGEVWVADQLEPIKRRVALKLIKPGMDSRAVLARFEAERQALALMDHPNIARVLDAGTTDDGRPYFVMELVKGTPITQFCDERKLSPRERLELFIPVCHAIQHAHQKGIIHRDIKPTNVLVSLHDEKPVPKVIDFGVAKAIGQQLTEKTLYTGFGALIGTPAYMAPEQATFNQLDIDTRADIYSLGVLLYELLAGSPPFAPEWLKETPLDEVLRVIREEEPQRPSYRLSTSQAKATIAAMRQSEPGKLTRILRGELDWVVMKALEKGRNRRYETANGFALDVQRYLADEPVLACPPSAGYRLRKFVRRNKAALAVTGLVFLFLVLLGSGIGWSVRDRAARDAAAAKERQDREAEATRQQEERRAKVAAQVEPLLVEVGRLEKEQKWPDALTLARRAAAAITGGEPDAATTNRVRQCLKDLEFIDRLERIRLRHGTSAFKETALGYARAFNEYGIDVEKLAVEASVELLKARPALVIPLAAALDDWVFEQRRDPQRDAAEWKRLVAVARGIDSEPLRDQLRATWGRPPDETRDELLHLVGSIDVRAQQAATLHTFAMMLMDPKRKDPAKLADAAIELLQEARSLYPGDYWLNYRLGLALVFLRKDRQGGLRYCTAAAAIRPDSPEAHRFLGVLWSAQGNWGEAAAAFRRAAELAPTVGSLHYRLGDALRRQGKSAEAIAAFRKALEQSPNDAEFNNDLAWQLATCPDARLRDPAQAVVLAKTANKLVPKNANYLNTLGVAQYRAGDCVAALAALETSMGLRAGGDSADWFFVAMAHWRLGAKDKAREWYDRAVEWMDKNQPKNEELIRFRTEVEALLKTKVKE
jgi:tetratricopeptide (TPR) repeat protein/tRNA A-37 threonylcarbamoyl transferase component Bud32